MKTRKPENVPTVDLLSSLPTDLKIFLCGYLCTNDFLNLILAARSFQPAYPYLSKRLDYPARRLLSHAALGEWEAAEAIWSTRPSFFLTCHGTIFHPNRVYQPVPAPPIDIPTKHNPGRYLIRERSPWQIAFMNEEYDEVVKMAKWMTDDEQRKQFLEIFPNGKIDKYNWDLDEAIILLDKLINAIIDDKSIRQDNIDTMSDSTKTKLDALYNYVKPAPEHKTGLLYDARVYLEAVRLFENRINHFQNMDQRTFWSIRVEEYLAALLGTGYLRQHSQGFGRDAKRTGCLLNDGSSYFSFRRDIQSTPGFKLYIGHCGDPVKPGEDAEEQQTYRGTGYGRSEAFLTLILRQNEKRDELMQQYSRQKKAACLIC